VVALLITGAGSHAHAHVEGTTRLTVFREPGQTRQGIEVIHPQGDVSAEIGNTLSVNAGYEVDIVSGATPQTFGPSSGPDAVSGATQFSDIRQAAHGGLSIQSPLIAFDAAYSYGWESDYKSHTGMVAAHGDFLEKNFTLNLAYTRNFDFVCDQNNGAAQSEMDLVALTSSERCFKNDPEVVSRRLDVNTFEPSLTFTRKPNTTGRGLPSGPRAALTGD
jgi:hypothetical protein